MLTKYDPINKEWISIGVKGDVPLAINDGISAYLSSHVSDVRHKRCMGLSVDS